MARTDYSKPFGYWTEERIIEFVKEHNITSRT